QTNDTRIYETIIIYQNLSPELIMKHFDKDDIKLLKRNKFKSLDKLTPLQKLKLMTKERTKEKIDWWNIAQYF
ncbi:MAG: hypothetical protein ACK4WJ_06375, partial [Endomicrobiia bacterium]